MRIEFIQLEDGLQEISGTGILQFDAGSMLRVDTATIVDNLDVVNVEYLNNALGSFGITHTIESDRTISTNEMYNVWGDFTIESGQTLNNDGRLVVVNGSFLNNGTYIQGTEGSVEIVNTNLDYILGRGNAVNGQDILWTDVTGNWIAGDSTTYLDTAAGNVHVTKEWVENKITLVPTLQLANKYESPLSTVGNDQDSGITIDYTPSNNGFVDVKINGMSVRLGDGVKTRDCYFSADGGTTARSITDVEAGDSLYWNGLIAGYDLNSLTDEVSLFYIS